MKRAFTYKIIPERRSKSKRFGAVQSGDAPIGFVIAETKEDAQEYLDKSAKRYGFEQSIYVLDD